MRALRQRGGVALLILLVAIVSVAGATVGPTYEHAARDSILHDTLASAPPIEQGVEISEDGDISGTVDGLEQQGAADLTAHGNGSILKLFQPAIESIQAALTFANDTTESPLVFRTDVCAHLQIRSGGCPTRRGQILISTSLAAAKHLAVGQSVHLPGWSRLHVSGIYNAPSATQPYWFDGGSVYFPTEELAANATSFSVDAMFTPRATLEQHRGTVDGTSSVDLLLNVPQIGAADIDRLDDGIRNLLGDETIAQQQGTVETGIPMALGAIHSSWSTLGVPVLVSTAELVMLAWLLLFVVVSDTIEARGTEVALVKLRGFGWLRTVRFAVVQPAALLIAALPIGTVIGWGAAHALTRVLFRSGTRVPLPASGWFAATLAVLGGLAAVLVASRRTLVRPVVDQWRRTANGAVKRGWVIDAVVVTGAVAGLIQMTAAGTIRSSSHGGVVLLAPALIGIAIAVPASRLLPVAARAAFGVTARGRGLTAFLAVRSVARRPGGARTTMTLATSFALVTFAIGAWTVGEQNRHRVADVRTGAPAVLTVDVPSHVDLQTAVDQADPSGRGAAAVLTYTNGPTTVIATQPDRFVHVANWLAGSTSRSLSSLPALLQPPEPAPVAVNGQKLRIRVDVPRLKLTSAQFSVDIAVPGADSATPVPLGAIRATQHATLTGRLPPGCGCTLADFSIESTGHLGLQPAPLIGQATIRRVSVLGTDGWQALPITASAKRWSPSGLRSLDSVTSAAGALHWRFQDESAFAVQLSAIDQPEPLPAVVATPVVAGGPGLKGVVGLDGRQLDVREIARSNALPGSPSDGVLVDLTYAERAADSSKLPATDQVWVTAAAREQVTRSLGLRGITVTSVLTPQKARAMLDRQGPGLASVLLLAAAAGGVLLAAGGAVLSLAITSRRRRFEYVALGVEGVKIRTLRGAIALEQLIVFGYGALVGIGAGIVAIVLCLKSTPEFVRNPAAPPLIFTPQWGSLLLALAAAVLVLAAAALLSGLMLVRSLDPDQLREAPA